MTKPFVVMPATDCRILELLSIYRFLTSQQLFRPGLAEHPDSFHRVAREKRLPTCTTFLFHYFAIECPARN